MTLSKATTRRQMERVLRKVFAAGENWGCIYHTWFEPSKADTEKHAAVAIKKVMDTLARLSSRRGK